ncbi:esterase B1 [Orussus abietinus]|uniref:esterase B1 n=1 Tax=Orussus abietinus TaxID=222816 RepID=UPI00062642BD|nr:esterase B1 [Orussus abietinus]
MADTIVRTRLEDLRGVCRESVYGARYFAFLGIPFAEPPVGLLRFQDPVPKKPWTGVLNAGSHGGKCAQLDVKTEQFEGGDDCLYLNVYKPLTRRVRSLPVMVWIHGGAFTFGCSDEFLYGPDFFMDKDVILVTVNYRLGVLGFLNLEDEVAPGNQGLKDQVQALRWVQENVSNFGGDPKNVTIFGESAGGASVHYLTLSPLAEGLFHKAICQSGVALNPWACGPREPRRSAQEIAAILGEVSTDPRVIVEFLRTVDAKTLVEAQEKMTTPERRMQTFTPFGPGPDPWSANPFLRVPISIAAQNGIKVPLIIGYNDREGIIFSRHLQAGSLRRLNADFEGTLNPAILESLKDQGSTSKDLRRLYFGDRPVTSRDVDEFVDMFSDLNFLDGIYRVVNIQRKGLAPTYLYRFSFDNGASYMKLLINSDIPGACHADELPYLFLATGLNEILGVEAPEFGAIGHTIVQRMTKMWSDFARTGNPTCGTADSLTIPWTPIEESTSGLKCLNIDIDLKVATIPERDRGFAWKLKKLSKL